MRRPGAGVALLLALAACGGLGAQEVPEVSATEAAAAAPEEEASVAPSAVALRFPYKHALDAARKAIPPENALHRLSEILAQVQHERGMTP